MLYPCTWCEGHATWLRSLLSNYIACLQLHAMQSFFQKLIIWHLVGLIVFRVFRIINMKSWDWIIFASKSQEWMWAYFTKKLRNSWKNLTVRLLFLTIWVLQRSYCLSLSLCSQKFSLALWFSLEFRHSNFQNLIPATKILLKWFFVVILLIRSKCSMGIYLS